MYDAQRHCSARVKCHVHCCFKNRLQVPVGNLWLRSRPAASAHLQKVAASLARCGKDARWLGRAMMRSREDDVTTLGSTIADADSVYACDNVAS